MVQTKPNVFRRVYDWTLSLAEKKSAGGWLAAISFAEASFFPIPPDVLLIPLCLGALRKALKFALICSIASVLGGAAGYAIGAFGWETVQDIFYKYVPGFTEEKRVEHLDGHLPLDHGVVPCVHRGKPATPQGGAHFVPVGDPIADVQVMAARCHLGTSRETPT